MSALETGSFLWASGLMDRLMLQALIFDIKSDKVAPQLKVGIHANAKRIWQTLPTN